MIHAALILSIIALLMSMASIIWLLAKQFSTHQIQMVPVDPFKDSLPGQIGKPFAEDFREIGDPVDSDELEHLEMLRKKKGKMT